MPSVMPLRPPSSTGFIFSFVVFVLFVCFVPSSICPLSPSVVVGCEEPGESVREEFGEELQEIAVEVCAENITIVTFFIFLLCCSFFNLEESPVPRMAPMLTYTYLFTTDVSEKSFILHENEKDIRKQ